MNAWDLPKSAVIGGTKYEINTDFRDVLEIIKYLNDPRKTIYSRWKIALSLFFEGDIPQENEEEAAVYLSNFVSCGNQDERAGPKLIDWDQDAHLIVADVNKVAGKEIRAEKYIHWWTFLAYFNGIGEGQLSTVVGIRSKKAKGKKLEKWEQEYYREHKKEIDFQQPEDPEEAAIKENIKKWL